MLGLCGIRTISQNFLALKPTFTIEVTTVQSDDGSLALTQAKWRLVGTGSNAHAPDLPSRLCFRKSSLVSLDLATCTTAHFRSRSSTASTLVALPSFYCGERDRHCCQWAGPRRIFVRAGPAAEMPRRGRWASAGRRGRPDEASPRAGGRAR